VRFQIGTFVVDVLVDIDCFELPIASFFPETDSAQLEQGRPLREPDYADFTGGMLLLAIQTFLLRSGSQTILIDTCVGEDKERPAIPRWPMGSNLSKTRVIFSAGTH
jgi:hypothetical protein